MLFKQITYFIQITHAKYTISLNFDLNVLKKKSGQLIRYDQLKANDKFCGYILNLKLDKIL